MLESHTGPQKCMFHLKNFIVHDTAIGLRRLIRPGSPVPGCLRKPAHAAHPDSQVPVPDSQLPVPAGPVSQAHTAQSDSQVSGPGCPRKPPSRPDPDPAVASPQKSPASCRFIRHHISRRQQWQHSPHGKPSGNAASQETTR